MALSQMAVRNAKPREKKYKLFDGGGRYLFIEPDGKQYWRLDYRHDGKRRTLALGVYPASPWRRSSSAAKEWHTV